MRMDTRTSISSQMNDLSKRPISVCYEIAEKLNLKSQCKVIAARAIAARAILKATEGSGVHLEQVLDRTEGKVPSGDAGGSGPGIQFVFNLMGQGAIPGSAGEVIQGVLASQGVNPVNPPLALAPLRTTPINKEEDETDASGAD